PTTMLAVTSATDVTVTTMPLHHRPVTPTRPMTAASAQNAWKRPIALHKLLLVPSAAASGARTSAATRVHRCHGRGVADRWWRCRSTATELAATTANTVAAAGRLV